MPGETGQVVGGNVVSEVVEKEEGVELGSIVEAKCAA
jgi:hypothetical protein